MHSRFAPFVLAVSMGLCVGACGGEPPKPPVVPKPAAAPGPFSKIVLPRTANVVWAVYKETWSTKPLTKPEEGGYDDGADETSGKLMLRGRDLVALTTLRPDASGRVTIPSDPPLGVSAQGSLVLLHRAHAILYAPGYTTLAWDSHDYADTPKPDANPPLAKEMTKTPAGCDALGVLDELLRDFPSARDTGLPREQFRKTVMPIFGDVLGMIVEGMPDPAPASEDPKQECDSGGSKAQSLHGKLEAMKQWVTTFPEETAVEGGEPPPPSAPPKITGDASRWRSVVDVWSARPVSTNPILDAFASGDAGARKPAILAAWGIGASDAVPGILKVLATKDSSDRAWAMWTLDYLGTPGTDAAPVLVDLLKMGDEKLQTFVIATLGRMGSAGRSAAEPLGKLLTDPNKSTRAAAFNGLVALRADAAPATSALTAALKASDVEDRRSALRVFTEMRGAAKDSVPSIAGALTDSDATIRSAAADTLRSLGKDAVSSVPALSDAIADSDARVRASALRALASFGPDALPALEKSKAALKDPDSNVRASAAFALGSMGPKASSAVPLLADLVKTDVATGTAPQENAARALGMLGAASKPALPTMMTVMKDTTSSPLRHALIDAVIDVGAPAAPEITKIVAACEEYGTWYVQSSIAKMGDKMGKAAVPQLGKLVSEKKDYVRRGALGALGKIGKDASSEVPQITKLLKEDGIRYYALSALEGIGPGAASAVDPLVDLADKNLDRYQALRTLSKIGTPAVAPLTKLMVDKKKDKYFRTSLTRAVLECGPGAAKSTMAVLETIEELASYDTYTIMSFRTVGKTAVQPLQTALKDSRAGIKNKAVLSLGYLGPEAAKDAIPVLLGAMKATDTKSAAMSSIQRYGKPTAQPVLLKILEDKTKSDLHDLAREVMSKNGW